MPDQPVPEIENKTVGEVYNESIKVGVSPILADQMVLEWLSERFGRKPRTFNYSKPLAEADPKCTVIFQRKFHHDNWQDGESVVQAGETVDEKGFNTRFHDIETDLDALAADLGKAVACLAELRLIVHECLDDIRKEFNYLYSLIARSDSQPKTPVTPVTPTWGGVKYIGISKFQDQDMVVLHTKDGYIMLPPEQSVVKKPVGGGDPSPIDRMTWVGDFADYVITTPDIRAAYPAGSIPLKDLKQRFGDREVKPGVTLRSIVDILPDEATYNNMDELINAVADTQGRTIRTSEASRRTVRETLGVTEEVTEVSAVPVNKMADVSPQISAALATAGVNTIGELAAANSEQVKNVLRANRVRATDGQVAGMIAKAKALSKVRG